jgi:hypothetical protein
VSSESILTNLAGILALSICVLAGCRSRLESQYSIINWPRSTLALIWGDDCANATADLIPDVYRMGASGELGQLSPGLSAMRTGEYLTPCLGTCRVFDGDVDCSRHFPPSINLAREILEDLAKADQSEDAALDTCREAIDKSFIQHNKAERLGKAMIAFLIVTIILCFTSSAASFVDGGIGPFTTGVLVVDLLFIFASLALVIAMVNFEGGGYLNDVQGRDYSDREMIGIAIWMMTAMLMARVLSSPWLTMMALVIILPIVLVFLLFLVRTRGFLWVVKAYAES